MILVRYAILTVAVAAAWAGPAEALGLYCTRPNAPYCLNQYNSLDDEWASRNCKSNVERYLSEVKSYIRCLDDEASNLRREADGIVSRFNCIAGGGRYCP